MNANSNWTAEHGQSAAEAMKQSIVENMKATGAGWRGLAVRIAEHATGLLSAGELDADPCAYNAALAHACIVRIAEYHERTACRIAGEHYEARPAVLMWGLPFEDRQIDPGGVFRGEPIVPLEDVATFHTAAVQAQQDLDRLLSNKGGAGAW